MKKWPFSFRSALAFMHDIAVAIFAWYSAFLLRFNFNIPLEQMALMKSTIIMVFVVEGITLISFGLYKGTWRFASLTDLKRILASAFVSSVILVSMLFIMNIETNVPRSILILNPILLILMMSGSRIIYRALKEHQIYGINFKQGKPVFIIGAGTTAISLIRDLSQSREWQVIGILDNDKSMHGREILGLKVFGPIELLSKMYERFKFRHAIIVLPLDSYEEKRFILNLANKLKLEILTIPAIDDLMSGRLNISQIRRVDVEDLLGRESVELDNSGLENLITNKVVMITGAGGSIGSELSRQALKFKPRLLICFDLSEYALYQLEQSFISDQIQVNILYIVGDVKNELRLRKIISQYQPNLVFHAAAYKHVPMMELCPTEAVRNNVIGVKIIADLAIQHKVERFVMISTDKAVNPTNVMGASKRMAEMYVQALSNQPDLPTKFITTRFGNVLGSNGSVIIRFKEQIEKGGPVTVTHPNITRYFMTIPEACQLVLEAGSMGNGGEIFVFDMGKPVAIADLAKKMIRLYGLIPNIDVNITYSGLRPGEKLYEELLNDAENTTQTYHEKILIAKVREVSFELVKQNTYELETILTTTNDEMLLVGKMKELVPEYISNNSIYQQLDSKVISISN